MKLIDSFQLQRYTFFIVHKCRHSGLKVHVDSINFNSFEQIVKLNWVNEDGIYPAPHACWHQSIVYLNIYTIFGNFRLSSSETLIFGRPEILSFITNNNSLQTQLLGSSYMFPNWFLFSMSQNKVCQKEAQYHEYHSFDFSWF